jgi:hypothetical protein
MFRAARYVLYIILFYIIIEFIVGHLPDFIRSLKKHQ